MKYTFLLIITLFAFGCSQNPIRQIRYTPVDKEFEKAKLISKKSNYTGDEAFLIADLTRSYLISGCGTTSKPKLVGSFWVFQIRSGYYLRYVGDLKINNENGNITYPGALRMIRDKSKINYHFDTIIEKINNIRNQE